MYHVSMIEDGYIEFERDERKAAINVKKHGVSFESAADAFSDSYAVSCRMASTRTTRGGSFR